MTEKFITPVRHVNQTCHTADRKSFPDVLGKDCHTLTMHDHAREKAIKLSKQIDVLSSLRASLVRKQKQLLKISHLCHELNLMDLEFEPLGTGTWT